MTVQRSACLALHSERLHADEVWDAVSRTLLTLEGRGAQATLFVYPGLADTDQRKLSTRLRELADRGHEIAQHTHYYSREVESGEKVGKENLLTPANIARCLDRDYEYLAEAGFRPRGFTSGGWVVHPAIWEWLGRRGFAYDCSLRTYRLGYPTPSAEAGNDHRTPFLRGKIVEILTTAPLRTMALNQLTRATSYVTLADVEYDLYYLHDADFRQRSKRWTTIALDKVLSRKHVARTTVGRLEELLRPNLASSGRV